VLERRRLLAAFAAAIVGVAVPHPTLAQDHTILVFAAASMNNALDEVDAAFSKKTGVKVVAKIAHGLGVPPSKLFEGVKHKP